MKKTYSDLTTAQRNTVNTDPAVMAAFNAAIAAMCAADRFDAADIGTRNEAVKIHAAADRAASIYDALHAAAIERIA